ncbi:Hypothetical_protein [Hexamita inflata]|uniref:Hypothetical_protein n=1 Tax=Hexamita inflata TaxID=28002 RepID=A0AA86QX31_9EUKA|nr:Hypothetical protein HINF_LOCUS55309 [Hexamita inflata]
MILYIDVIVYHYIKEFVVEYSNKGQRFGRGDVVRDRNERFVHFVRRGTRDVLHLVRRLGTNHSERESGSVFSLIEPATLFIKYSSSSKVSVKVNDVILSSKKIEHQKFVYQKFNNYLMALLQLQQIKKIQQCTYLLIQLLLTWIK